MKNTNQLIGCCGLDCEICDARIATLTNDNELREKTAALWTKLNGVPITPEMINCTGCRMKGVKTPFCDKLCPVHNCVREKGLDTCADCEQMEGCPTLGRITENNPSVMDKLKFMRKSIMNNKALVVIDLQNDITKNYREIIETTNQAIDWAVANGMKVIYIKHNNLSAGTRTFKPDTPGAEFVPELKIVSDNIFVKTIITYGSQYGSAEHYARKFAEYTGFPVLPYSEVKSAAGYERVIHFGALYAGGVLGLRHVAALLAPKTELVIVTVGLADVQDAENIQNIRKAIRRQVPEETFRHAQIFHLRGAIDYGKLNLKHRTMMALLYAKAKRLPEEKKNAETRSLIETYGKQVSFVNDDALERLKDTILRWEQ